MTYKDARKWIVTWSFGLMTVYGAVFIVGPALRYPLAFDQSIQLLQIVFPLFLGYLSTAIVFMFEGTDAPPAIATPELLGLLTKGPFVAASIMSLALFVAFWIANSTDSGSALSDSMSFETFSSIFSLVIGIYTATTSALVAYLFKKERQ
ncbi:hypothetical protein HFO71_31380 [Rhizobium laguerreae]|uniref:hypothetical protein n=1 Tax=Rhizobium laguerreae TaxID=1076926 RepID=UPI001C918AF6|nr:hypothetical protein [Rhizobium laguerreae]MBY3074814.1 hypothetical protein [Rhizobium laguerreae]MBY3088868.1 hypothetical protein [Rhizobium laguerreae]MBY3129603.1 hypothetical protein [Rhizobium laguerreae]